MKTDRMTTSFKTYSFTGTPIIENPIQIQKILVNHFVIKYYCKKKNNRNSLKGNVVVNGVAYDFKPKG